ncbi:MAG TPA: ethanolamine ammonia-lyase subunit EutC [Caulifigura sp.]|jgi:ethanolamine ammonia-lyase small subunit|nr:ethanolamine ammonia-lyase subunit EutC [Caulifigura sp.]
MSDGSSLPTPSDETSLDRIRELTTARLFLGRSGLGYRTATQLELRTDHAAARDAVQSEFVLARDFSQALIEKYQLLGVESQAETREEFLRRPDLGRRVSMGSRQLIVHHLPGDKTVQVAIGDGLSAESVRRQCPELLPRLMDAIAAREWTSGPVLCIRHCRVGVMNDIGDLLRPQVVILLIGERPGLMTAESLSAYLAYRPKAGDTDAQRNLISNIHSRGVSIEAAVVRIVALVDEMLRQGRSGYEVKESLPPPRFG